MGVSASLDKNKKGQILRHKKKFVSHFSDFLSF